MMKTTEAESELRSLFFSFFALHTWERLHAVCACASLACGRTCVGMIAHAQEEEGHMHVEDILQTEEDWMETLEEECVTELTHDTFQAPRLQKAARPERTFCLKTKN